MKRIIFGLLSMLVLLLAVSAPASAQETIPVCILGFESTPGVEYLTAEQIAEIEATVDDQTDIPTPKVVGYPDPVTDSCATEYGELLDYDPEVFTPICVPSGPEGNGPLVVQFGINHYLRNATDLIYADPNTGKCAEEDTSRSAPVSGNSDSDTDEGATSDLLNTGAGMIADDGQSALVTGLGFATVSAMLFAAGLRTVRRSESGPDGSFR